MKTVLTYKDRDSELKRGQHRTSTVECSAGWQPPPHMWPSTVQKPVSVWGSTDHMGATAMLSATKFLSAATAKQRLPAVTATLHAPGTSTTKQATKRASTQYPYVYVQCCGFSNGPSQLPFYQHSLWAKCVTGHTSYFAE